MKRADEGISARKRERAESGERKRAVCPDISIGLPTSDTQKGSVPLSSMNCGQQRKKATKEERNSGVRRTICRRPKRKKNAA